MLRIIKIATLLGLISSSNLLAVNGGNCWDPRTWGHPDDHCCNVQAETSTEMPLEFFADASVRRNFETFLSGTFAESQSITLKKIIENEKTVYIFTSVKDPMPPSERVVSHFSVITSGADVIRVSDIEQGDCCGCHCAHKHKH